MGQKDELKFYHDDMKFIKIDFSHYIGNESYTDNLLTIFGPAQVEEVAVQASYWVLKTGVLQYIHAIGNTNSSATWQEQNVESTNNAIRAVMFADKAFQEIDDDWLDCEKLSNAIGFEFSLRSSLGVSFPPETLPNLCEAISEQVVVPFLKDNLSDQISNVRSEIKKAISANGEAEFEEWYSSLNLPKQAS